MIRKMTTFFVFVASLLCLNPTAHAVTGYIPDSTLTGIDCTNNNIVCFGNFTINDTIWNGSIDYCFKTDDSGACIQAYSKVSYSTSPSVLENAFIQGEISLNNSSKGFYYTGYANCANSGSTSIICDAVGMKQQSDSQGNLIWVPATLGNFSVSVDRTPTPCPNGGTYFSGYGCTTPTGTGSTTGQPTNRTVPSLPNTCEECAKKAAANLINPNGPNPISLTTGAEVESKQDLDSPIAFSRNYNSNRTSPNILGNGWRYVFDKHLTLTTTALPNSTAASFVSVLDFNEENDDDIVFSRTSATANFESGYADQNGYKLNVTGSNYTLIAPNGTQETYAIDGTLSSWKSRSGYTLNFTYNSGKLTTITDSLNHSLTLTYNGNLLSHIVSDNGDTMDYSYNNGNLIAALYNNLLSSMTDEKGNLYTVIQYDSQNRANFSANVLGTNTYIHQFTATYSSSSNVTATLSTGSSFSYNLSPVIYKTNATSGSISGTSSTQYSLGYDANGNVNSYYDGNNNHSTMIYSGDNLLQTMTLPNGLVTNYTWDTTQRLMTGYTQPSANGTRTVNMVYDTFGNLLQQQSVTTSGNRTTNYTYSTLGRILTATDASGAVTNYTYYPDTDTNSNERGLIKTIQNALNQAVTVNSYDNHGNPTSITNANGITKTMTFDLRSRLVSETVGQATNNYQYDAVGNMIQATLANGYILSMTYDQAHRMTSLSDNLGASTTYTLDDNDMPTNEQTTLNSNLVTVKNRVFDNLSQLKKFYHTNSSEAFAYAYDTNGNRTNITDTNSHSRTTYYDNLNRVSGMNGMGLSETVGYDNDSNVNTITANSQVTTYQSDDFSELTQIVSPDTGTTNLTYDIVNRVKTATDNAGTVHTTHYDSLGRTTSISHVNGSLTQNETFTYDSATHGVGYLASMTDSSGSTSYTYDSLGNTTSKTQNIGSFTKTVNYGYDSFNQPTSITYPSGLIATYSYTNGQVTGLSLSGEVTGIVMNQIQYRPFSSNPTNWMWGNSATMVNSYNTDEKLTSIVDANAINQTFSMDGSGNINSVTDNVDTTKSYTTVYDNAYNLNRFIQNGVADIYFYDSNNNRNSSSLNIGNNPASYNYAFTYNTNLMKSYNGNIAYTVSLDSKGNMLSDAPNRTFTYDLKNNLNGFTNGTLSYSYAFNAMNQRVSKTGNGLTTYFIYDENGNLLSEYDSLGNILAEHIYLNGLPVAVVKNNTIYYVHTDSIGTPRVITDTSNNKVWGWDNVEPFGNNLATENGLTNYNLRFSGQYFDKEDNLHYNNMRIYNPILGRYMQTDPIGLSGGANTFAYVGNNSLNYSDSLGLYNNSDLLDDTTDWVAGFGDNLSFGLSKDVRNYFNLGHVDTCSNFYNGGDLGGIAFSLAFGATKGGLESSVQYAGKRSVQWSHWIPGRFIRSTSKDFSPILNNVIGKTFVDSSLNGNYVSRNLHALSDDYAFKFLPKTQKNLLLNSYGEWSPIRQQINRVPYWIDGTIYSSGSRELNSNSCTCNQ